MNQGRQSPALKANRLGQQNQQNQQNIRSSDASPKVQTRSRRPQVNSGKANSGQIVSDRAAMREVQRPPVAGTNLPSSLVRAAYAKKKGQQDSKAIKRAAKPLSNSDQVVKALSPIAKPNKPRRSKSSFSPIKVQRGKGRTQVLHLKRDQKLVKKNAYKMEPSKDQNAVQSPTDMFNRADLSPSSQAELSNLSSQDSGSFGNRQPENDAKLTTSIVPDKLETPLTTGIRAYPGDRELESILVSPANRKASPNQANKTTLSQLKLNFIKPHIKRIKKMGMRVTGFVGGANQEGYRAPESAETNETFIREATTSLVSPSLLNYKQLRRDGRKTPDQYRRAVQAALTPAQLSIKSISEYYILQPNTQFVTAEDVFLYRGYKKLQKIDEGAFGVVSKVIRLTDNRYFAVKEVDLRRKRAKRIEEMKRELFMLQQINHENVVRLIEHFIIGQMLVIIMEFCAGNNLTTYLKDSAVNEQEARHLFKQMAMSIKVLHKRGFAHRDVKLNNFLLDSTRKHVKVSDFGLSVVSFLKGQGVTMARTYCGTEPYMAPEILRRNHFGIRSYNPIYADIWSLGVCLFAMLTRTFPFKVQTSQDTLYKAQNDRKWRFPRSLRSVLSDEIKDLVWHMLDPEPDRRITITGVLAHPWINQNQLVVLTMDESDSPVLMA